ncbi:hypothetical protein [Mycobacterium paragordonae]|uniref:hypothetical protein n=1 Tax=Mycobacterium paragordonae TaxID=1389713 RepID=UPI0012E12DAA|nr:hypothetical protein [Mycobacterium paragordonae]
MATHFRDPAGINAANNSTIRSRQCGALESCSACANHPAKTANTDSTHSGQRQHSATVTANAAWSRASTAINSRNARRKESASALMKSAGGISGNKPGVLLRSCHAVVFAVRQVVIKRCASLFISMLVTPLETVPENGERRIFKSRVVVVVFVVLVVVPVVLVVVLVVVLKRASLRRLQQMTVRNSIDNLRIKTHHVTGVSIEKFDVLTGRATHTLTINYQPHNRHPLKRFRCGWAGKTGRKVSKTRHIVWKPNFFRTRPNHMPFIQLKYAVPGTVVRRSPGPRTAI